MSEPPKGVSAEAFGLDDDIPITELEWHEIEKLAAEHGWSRAQIECLWGINPYVNKEASPGP